MSDDPIYASDCCGDECVNTDILICPTCFEHCNLIDLNESEDEE